MTPLQRFQAALQRDQDRLNERLNPDAELVREYRDEDEGKGEPWAIALPRTVATREPSPKGVSALRASVNYRRAQLVQLYLSGMPFRLIALEYGGTAQGVRSTVRKMRERGVLPDRPQPLRGEWA